MAWNRHARMRKQEDRSAPPDRSLPGALSTRSVALTGLVGLLLTCLVSIGLRYAGVTLLWGLVVLVVPCLILVGFGLFAAERGRAWRYAVGPVLMFGTPIAVFVLNDAPLLGRIAEGPVAEIASDRGAVAYRPTDAVAHRDLSRIEAVARGGGRGRSGYTVAYVVGPVVGPGWKTGDPVLAWAVVRGRSVPDSWSAPGGLILPAPSDDHAAVVSSAAARLRVAGAPEPLIGEWVPDPRAAMAAERLKVATILGAAALLWLAMMLTGRRTA